MDHQILHLPAFSCLGLQALVPLDDPTPWVSRLWADFWRRSGEIEHLRKGIWGLMSDPEVFLAPWGGARGLYLAGFEVPDQTPPSGDWRLWTVPAGHWLSIPTRLAAIPQTVELARKLLEHDLDWFWSGAVHESYPLEFRDPRVDEIRLLFTLDPR